MRWQGFVLNRRLICQLLRLFWKLDVLPLIQRLSERDLVIFCAFTMFVISFFFGVNKELFCIVSWLKAQLTSASEIESSESFKLAMLIIS